MQKYCPKTGLWPEEPATSTKGFPFKFCYELENLIVIQVFLETKIIPTPLPL